MCPVQKKKTVHQLLFKSKTTGMRPSLAQFRKIFEKSSENISFSQNFPNFSMKLNTLSASGNLIFLGTGERYSSFPHHKLPPKGILYEIEDEQLSSSPGLLEISICLYHICSNVCFWYYDLCFEFLKGRIVQFGECAGPRQRIFSQ